MPSLAVSLLGSFQISVNDQNMTAALRTEKERALLAYLAVETDHPHSRETLAELLWPERPEGVARTNLRQALLGVRRAIGDRDTALPFLKVDDESIQFNTEQSYWVDIEAFNTHIEATFAHDHKSLETCISCAQHLQQAVELYRGDFMAGLFLPDSPSFQEWVVFHREQYFRYLLSALQTLSDYFQNLGDFELAQKYARRLVSLDPLDESAHRRLMIVLANSGRRAAALEQFQACRRMLLNEFQVEPSIETVSIYERIKNGDVIPTKPTTGSLKRVNLPTQLTSFVGREAELEWLAQMLNDPSRRFISIVGMGGVGKTRLALRAAEVNSDLFPDGVRFIPLDTIRSPDLIIPSIAQAFGFTFRGDAEPKKQLIRVLRPLRTLLVIDNVEHLLDQTALLLEILQQASGVKLLVTTRQRLNYQAATIYELKGLAYPAAVDDPNALDYPAVQLFLNRAARSRAGYLVSDQELPFIVQICRLVDGLPLAIELAASRMRELSCEQIMQELQRDLGVLCSAMLDMPERHRSMRAVLDQSWQQLTDEEKVTFRRLSAFQNGFTLEAAQKIAAASLPLLSGLMDKSFLQGDAAHGFGLHPLWKQYAAEKLAELPDENDRILDLHSEYFVEFLLQRDADLRKYPLPKSTLLEIETQIENIRSALARASFRKKTSTLTQGIETLKRFYDLRDQYRSVRSSGSEPPLGGERAAASADDRQRSPLEDFSGLIGCFRRALGERVSDVRLGDRLGDTPARLVDPAGTAGKDDAAIPQKVLEINPRHDILAHLRSLPEDSPLVPIIIEQIYENALLIAGLHPDPAGMINRIQRLMEAALGKGQTG